jgi:hypothetical protein
VLPDAGSKPAWETLGRTTGEHQASHSFPPAIPRINPHSLLDRLTLPWKKTKQNNWMINKELKTTTQQRGRGAVSTPEKGGGARSWSQRELSVNKGWKCRRADSGRLISCCLK